MDFLIQAGLAFFGACSYLMLTSKSPRARLLSPFVGVAGQPFWLVSAIQTHAWGMLFIALMFTGVYVRGMWVSIKEWK